MGVLALSFEPPSQLVLSGPAVPVAAVYESATDQATVIFDIDIASPIVLVTSIRFIVNNRTMHNNLYSAYSIALHTPPYKGRYI